MDKQKKTKKYLVLIANPFLNLFYVKIVILITVTAPNVLTVFLVSRFCKELYKNKVMQRY